MLFDRPCQTETWSPHHLKQGSSSSMGKVSKTYFWIFFWGVREAAEAAASVLGWAVNSKGIGAGAEHSFGEVVWRFCSKEANNICCGFFFLAISLGLTQLLA